jgi:hypothetical protein
LSAVVDHAPLKYKEHMERVPEEAALARIADLQGQEHELRSTWARQPVVLAFVRHFA